jgi:SPP1 gp7 family putative phage head morphogenesis protein
VTSPFGEQQQGSQDQGRERNAAEDAVVAALAIWLLTRPFPGLSLPTRLKRRLEGLDLTPRSIDDATDLTLSDARPPLPTPGDLVTTSVGRVQREAPTLQARYLLAAAKRLTTAQTLNVYPAAERLERGYALQAASAAQNRVRAASALDRVAASSLDGLVRWVTAGDDRVDPECAVLEGTVFDVSNPPGGKVPGSVHPRCRCTAASVGNRPALSLVR